MVRTVRKVPEEWAKFKPIGEIIPNTRIFAFKTPIKFELRNRIRNVSPFTTQDFFRQMVLSERTVGLVINACNTERYYDKADIEGMMVGYKWVPSPGRNFLNRDNLVKIFCKTIDDFLEDNEQNDYLIGVHCSNGVNRAGYLICRYLIDRLGWNSHDAIIAFEQARGYAIERGSFIQALHKARERRLKGTDAAAADEPDDAAKAERKKKRKRKHADADSEIPGLDPALTKKMMQQFYQIEQEFMQAAESAISGSGGAVTSSGTSNASPFLGAPPSSLHSHHAQMLQSPANLSGSQLHQHNVGMAGGDAHNRAMISSYSQRSKITASGDVGSSSSMLYENFNTAANASTSTLQNEIIAGEDEQQDDEEDEDEKGGAQNRFVDLESMGKVDVRETSSSTSRRIRRKRLDEQFHVMKRGKFWEINEMRKRMGM